MSNQPLTSKRFGLSAAELRAKREAKRAARAEKERQVEVAALVERIEWALSSSKPTWDSAELVAIDVKHDADALEKQLFEERFERQYRVELECLRIRESYRPMIEAARSECAGSAVKRKLKREAKEARRQQRANLGA